MHIQSHSTNQPQPVPLRWSGERLYIDLDEANRNLLAAVDADPATAAALARVWQPFNAWVFVDPPDKMPKTGDVSGTFPPPHLRKLHRDYPVRFADDVLAASKKLAIATIHTDRPDNAFVDTERVVQAVEVRESIAVTEAVSPDSSTASYGHADPAKVKAPVGRPETFVIRPGNYLLCWHTRWARPLLHTAAYVEQHPSDDQVATAAGFGARELFAACEECGQSWTARDGISRFEPDQAGGQPWNFTGRPTTSVTALTCPATRCIGSVRITNLRHPRP